jgi:hypothetical protein
METECKTVNLNDTPKLWFSLESVQRFSGCKRVLIDVETLMGTCLQGLLADASPVACQSWTELQASVTQAVLSVSVLKMRLEVLKCFQVGLHVPWSTFSGTAYPIDAARLRFTCAVYITVFGKTLAGAPLRREDEQYTIVCIIIIIIIICGVGLSP